MNCIHCTVVDLITQRQDQGIPYLYSPFMVPYKLQLQILFCEEDIVLQIVYHDKLLGVEE